MRWVRSGTALAAMAIAASTCEVVASLDGLTGGSLPADATVDSPIDAPASDALAESAPPDSAPSDGAPSDGAPSDGAPPDSSDAAFDADASDAGSPDASDAPASDAPTSDAAAWSCADSSAILCDDFENGLDVQKWQNTNQDHGTITVDTSRPHAGTQSLHAVASAIAADAGLTTIFVSLEHIATPPPDFHVRLFAYWPVAPPSTQSFVYSQQSQSPYLGLQLEVDDQAHIGLSDWTPPQNTQSTVTPVPIAAWACVEWEVASDGADSGTAHSRTWIGGNEVLGLHLSGLGLKDLGEIGIGTGFYQAGAQPKHELWIDDVVIDTKPIGCGP